MAVKVAEETVHLGCTKQLMLQDAAVVSMREAWGRACLVWEIPEFRSSPSSSFFTPHVTKQKPVGNFSDSVHWESQTGQKVLLCSLGDVSISLGQGRKDLSLFRVHSARWLNMILMGVIFPCPQILREALEMQWQAR